MKSQAIHVSVLYGTGTLDPEFRESLLSLRNLKLVQEALDPEMFLAQHSGKPSALVLVDLDGMSTVPPWLKHLIARLPQSQVLVCSQSRDPDFLIRIMELRAAGYLPLPLNREELAATLERVETAGERNYGGGRSQILVVTGTKGGVGTTAIATNVAVALAEILPEKVVLVDLARPFPHVGQFLDLKFYHSIMDLGNSADSLDPMFIGKVIHKHKSNLEVLLSSTNHNLKSHTLPDSKAMDKIFAALRSLYHYVVVDLGAWLDEFYIQVLQEADRVLLVTELTVPDMQDLKIIKTVFQERELDEEKVKVVVNRYIKDYALRLKDLENILLRPVFCTLPYEHPLLIEAINQGMPLGEVAPRSKLWRGMKDLAAELVAESQPQIEKRPGLFRRLFS